MQIKSNATLAVKIEAQLYQELFDFEGQDVVELGCGDGSNSLGIANTYPTCRINAYEVDEIQLAKNFAKNTPPNLKFCRGGAERIAQPDASADIVMMFKSLHHVPLTAMDQAMEEIGRILRPNGLLYVSEPVFAGAFNEVIRLFHDEQAVREAAFAAEQKAVLGGLLKLERQEFFLSPQRFENFAAFEQRMLGATYADHQLDEEIYAEVKRRFMQHMSSDGAKFESPMRVDLLRAP